MAAPTSDTSVPVPGIPTRTRGCVDIWRFSSSGMYGGSRSKADARGTAPAFSPFSDDVVATLG